MKNRVLLTLFVVFLIFNITPASSVGLGEFNKDLGDLGQYNKDKVENMGYFEKLKLLWNLPKIIKKSGVLLDEAETENKVFEKQKVDEENTVRVMSNFFKNKAARNASLNGTEDQTVITAPSAAIKDANNTLNVKNGVNLEGNLSICDSTLLFENGAYDLESGDIVQLYVENHFVYACFISQDIFNGCISLRAPERQVNMTVEKFQDSSQA